MGKATNAGVHNAIGIEFQKHCALYLLFHDYSILKSKQYFICIEHYDDVLFCHEGNTGDIELINSYQVKKASTPWGLGKEFYELLSKMAGTGRDLKSDPVSKSAKYSHSLSFATNNSISLSTKKTATKPSVSVSVNEANTCVSFLDLPKDIQDLINKKIESFWSPDQTPLSHVELISLEYLDLPRTSRNQIDMLETQFRRFVNPDIADASAAVEMLLKLFRDVETTLNNGNVSKLLDRSKRVESVKINEALKIINTNQKAYDFWRDEGKELAKKLRIPIADAIGIKKHIADSFDLFKDKKQIEHRAILNFVESRINLFYSAVDEIELINDLYTGYIKIKNSPLTTNLLKAAIVAAYIQTKETL